MRQLGQTMNPRDERGWMIPRPGTKRRQVYDALIAGTKAGKTILAMGLTRKAYDNHRHFIMSWQKANASNYAVKNR
jgi:FixJ family two-component response regulator